MVGRRQSGDMERRINGQQHLHAGAGGILASGILH